MAHATVRDVTTGESISLSACVVGAGPPYLGMCASPADTAGTSTTVQVSTGPLSATGKAFATRFHHC